MTTRAHAEKDARILARAQVAEARVLELEAEVERLRSAGQASDAEMDAPTCGGPDRCCDDLCRGEDFGICGEPSAHVLGLDCGERDCSTCRDFVDPEPCPMGCGGLTYDPYGGPCDRCWDDAPREG